MSKAGIVAGSTLGGLAIALLFAWVTWNHMLTPVDRVFILMLFGIGSLDGQ